ncbi:MULTISPECIES: FliM/FliN family flagellar motor switch protein [Asticcacaulis]|uniref:FliM/FliN family flagellar motor switch protein n=1 Tax=Asticcacaulis TaxID=76890 RepID=UPI001AE448E6|nr:MULTISPECIES: FliM/FliN family flagellar motor switch protein [Asticcacaulis]MBP2161168.1 flagellar motor switch protein FliN/FliY [Asticcacaulis solisilvae]MDR6802213.1 flagellar motor switch protein FliN/FliY [Asticcacaulis sp. BE141]
MNSRVDSKQIKGAAAANAQADGTSQRQEGRPIIAVDSPIFKDVNVVLNAALGRAELSVQEILALRSGSVVRLEAKLNDLVELRLNDALIARGEIVAVDGSFAIRIVEIAQLS